MLLATSKSVALRTPQGLCVGCDCCTSRLCSEGVYAVCQLRHAKVSWLALVAGMMRRLGCYQHWTSLGDCEGQQHICS